MKIVYLFSIYYFFFSLLVQLPVIFKDNSLFSLSTISLPITSIEERKGKGNETRFLGISINGLLKKKRNKKEKKSGNRTEKQVVLVFNLRFESSVFIGIPFRIQRYFLLSVFLFNNPFTSGDSTRHSFEKRREAADRS